MERISVFSLCSIFLLISYCGCPSGAKKKKDLETIVEYKPATCQDKADNGDIVSVHYTGTLENGQMFDSSRAQGRQPLEFQLGKGKVIKGWEMGIKGMCIGEKRKLIIPPHLGYGSRGVENVIPRPLLFQRKKRKLGTCGIYLSDGVHLQYDHFSEGVFVSVMRYPTLVKVPIFYRGVHLSLLR
ncbi:FK506-binding protein 2-like isoform X2 [Porites lutea]|uniref:FK506-binding protein 2-like isoform X2 n=1 Tax=Porites lutea TaxID=51062 RepID=UPI003CC6964C